MHYIINRTGDKRYEVFLKIPGSAAYAVGIATTRKEANAMVEEDRRGDNIPTDYYDIRPKR